jgi:hypothetical protein
MTDADMIERSEEGFDAGDKCGRCGCARRDHTPACASHPKCKHFSAAHKPKPKNASGPRCEKWQIDTGDHSGVGQPVPLTGSATRRIGQDRFSLRCKPIFFR